MTAPIVGAIVIGLILAAAHLPNLPLPVVIVGGLAAIGFVPWLIVKGRRQDRMRAALIDAQEHP